ncbi:hypothetical protein A2160_04490 [Candidatus Beckwithbacteria bacterium RBG_13_42_9]|uniref:DUF5667 domain-containing protein n=1 Tax=Candidatus Beckwithbacteria bacterium RBG_13_42_9 TaxID=1797457 RepID=A0A1F5E8E0_9BACT|nr:MAG: hypothetical protein A2160_04490 [Candidatus Beckwithbacteria bacterium RBG_13_42_9]
MRIATFIYSFTAIFFGLTLVIVSCLRLSEEGNGKLSSGTVLAKEAEKLINSQEATSAAEKPAANDSASDKTVDYYLPYPGILPDHPLYWLKMARDRMTLWLTQDPQAKFDRLLLYADKRLGAAQVLVEGNQVDLGATTATKGEKYLEQAISQFQVLKANGKVTPELQTRVQKALLKHQELLTIMMGKVPDQMKSTLDKARLISSHGLELVSGQN